jgi:hypothetical protein
MEHEAQIKKFIKHVVMDQNPAEAERTIQQIIRDKVDQKFKQALERQKNSDGSTLQPIK